MNTAFDKIVLASNNAGKVKELTAMLAEHRITIIPQGELGVEDAIEDGKTFVENALIKARHASAKTGLPAIADDSGLSVNALNGAPGIYSARFAGTHGDDAANNQRLIEKLAGLPREQRGGFFHCSLAFLQHADDPTPLIASANWYGTLLEAPQGKNGFGYDPLFWVAEKQCSSAELAREVKNKISHRGQAMQSFLAQFAERFGQ